MSEPLTAMIRAEIAQKGSISFRRFMEQALYHPEQGYYASGRARVGRKGDFFTNVSVGPLFGKLLARQFAEIWRRLGEPPNFSIVEQGAHEGHFAFDVLAELKEAAPKCFAAVTYRIVEPFQTLATRQRDRLAGWPVVWTSAFSELPAFTGVHFSNELIDAFPVNVVKWTGSEWVERRVDFDGAAFTFVDRPIVSRQLVTACARIPMPLPAGYITEVNLAAAEWIAEIAAKVERGFIVAIDYGFLRDEYYMSERKAGTLSAYANHRREPDPLRDPGAFDLTSHVDFTSVMEAGAVAGLHVAGFTDQHHLMVGLGAAFFPDGTPIHPTELRAFQTLMHPTLMGMAFKILALEKGTTEGGTLMGFQYARPAAKNSKVELHR